MFVHLLSFSIKILKIFKKLTILLKDIKKLSQKLLKGQIISANTCVLSILRQF